MKAIFVLVLAVLSMSCFAQKPIDFELKKLYQFPLSFRLFVKITIGRRGCSGD